MRRGRAVLLFLLTLVALTWGLPRVAEISAEKVLRQRLQADEVRLALRARPWALLTGRIQQATIYGTGFATDAWTADRFRVTAHQLHLRPLDLMLQRVTVTDVGRVEADLYFGREHLDLQTLSDSPYLSRPEVTFAPDRIVVAAALHLDGDTFPATLTLVPVLRATSIGFRVDDVQVAGHRLPEGHKGEVAAALERVAPELSLVAVSDTWQVKEVAAGRDGIVVRLRGRGAAILP